jgi:hypothetical protein
MSLTPGEGTELEEAIMQADLANKQADTNYKQGLLRYEPWKVALGGLVGGAALLGACLTFLNWVRPAAPTQPMFPPGTVITIPGAAR